MHGYNSGSDVVVNAEVDSMGGFVDGGVGIGVKTSPRRAAIEKAQADLRQEYDVREERRRELEFLEKGGNPLDFNCGNTATLSVQSTSLTGHNAEHLVNSEAKGSFALTASPRGDSVESIGRPGVATIYEANTADNFDGENEIVVGQRRFKKTCRRSADVPGPIDVLKNVKDSDDSAIFRPYARRNRSKPNRDGARTSVHELQGQNVQGSTSANNVVKDSKLSLSECNDKRNQNSVTLSVPKFLISNGDSNIQVISSGSQLKNQLIVDGNPNVSPLSDISRGQIADGRQNNPMENDRHISLVDAETSADFAFDGKENAVSSSPEILDDEAKNVNNLEPNTGSLGTVNDDLDRMKGLDSGLLFETKDEGFPEKHLVDANRSRGPNNVFEDGDRFTEERAPEVEVHGGDSFNDKCIENDEDAKIANTLLTTSKEFPSENANHAIISPTGEDSKVSVVNIQCCEKSDIETGEIKIFASELIKSIVDTGNDSAVQASVESVGEDLKEPVSSKNLFTSVFNCSSDNVIKPTDKVRDDSILEEARTIEAKRKRIAELSVGSSSFEIRAKSHWDFVLEEMAWLAYDFAQERLWKKTAVAQIGRRVAMSCSFRYVEHNKHEHLRRLACTLAKAVMQFWHSAETLVYDAKASMKHANQDFGSFGVESSKDDTPHFNEKKKHTGDRYYAIKDYAARFLAYNCSFASQVHAESSKTNDRVESSWTADNRMEESLFYAIPAGAMQMYRSSVESHVAQVKKKFNSLREKAGSMTDYCYPGMEFVEEEGETSTHYINGEFSNLTKHDHKKQKNVGRAFSVRPYKQAPELMHGHTLNSQQQMTTSKKATNNYGVGTILPKRIRTASRQRVVGHGNAGVTAPLQISSKTDVSSGDTNSFQDDQSVQNQRSVEVESVGDFAKQMAYEFTDASKPRKKKKTKHLDSAYEQVWQADSVVPHDIQKGSSKKRTDNLIFDSTCASGLYGQSAGKKPKLLKQNTENSFDNTVPISGSIPSPAASQMSNMSNTNKFVKMFNGRERVRKSKIFKITSGQSDSGSPWSLFEDQALVVLVHDLGPNWELVSDAMNNTLQFKCIYRNPKECKDRHKILMDKGAGDGADSAEDSGSSQSYPSTLPGIPKGSARQLFQRLQGPVEEDTLKSHFEMIIMIEKKQYCRRSQNDYRDGMQPVLPHNSHMAALSQVCPNNLNGGILTPLDLCEPNPACSDALSLGFHSSLGSNVISPGQPSNIQTLPNAAPNSCLPSTSGAAHGGSSQSSSIQQNSSARDGRYVSRGSVPADEQHRIQQYNQMLSARNTQSLSATGSLPTVDRGGVRLLSGGNGMPIMQRNAPITRPGLQGMASSPMVNSGNMTSPTMRPHFMRPGHNDQQRQVINQEHQGQNNQSNGQGFSNQTGPPSVKGYSVPHPHQQSHVLNNPHHPASQQQAFAIRVAKERQLQQQRLIQQQQQQFATSGAMMTHPQTQSQLPLSAPMQINQIPIQTSSQSISVSPPTSSPPMNSVSASQKHNSIGLGSQGGSSGSANQGAKSRNRPESVTTGRNHPQPRQSPQNSKASKGLGRGNIMVHQNLVDHSHLNGLALPHGSDKGEQMMNIIQTQGMYSASGMVGTQPSKSIPSPQKSQASLTKLVPLSNSDSSSQTPVHTATSGHGLPSPQQAVPSHGSPSNHSHFHQQIHQKQVTHPLQNVPRAVQPIYRMGSDHCHIEPEVLSDLSMASSSGAPVIQSSNNAVAGLQVLPNVPQQWNNPETFIDSVVSNPNPQQSGGSETLGCVNDGLIQRQLSGNLSKVVPSQQLYHLQEQQVEQDNQSPRKQ